MRVMQTKVFKVALVMVCWIVAGCNGGSSSSTGPVAVDQIVSGPVRGTVMTDEPVVGALVQLYTHDGQPLPGEALTNANGIFEIPVDEARYGLQVVAIGGSTASSGHFAGTLSAYIEPFEAEFGVPLTPVTTMVDRLRLTAALPAAEAEQRIATYLGLESGRSVRSDFRYLHDFNSSAFMADSTPFGFDGLVDMAVAEAAADPEMERRYRLLQLSPLASMLGMELIKGAVSGTSSSLTGHLLAKMGLDSGTAAILGQLQTISRQLSALQATVDDIARDVKELRVSLSVEGAKDLINSILTLWHDLENLDRFSGSALEQEKLRIFHEIERLYPRRMLISNMLNGNLGTISPIQLYAEFLRDTNHFYSQKHYNMLHDFIEFYDVLNVQLHYLLIEAENWRSRNDAQGAAQRVAALEKEVSAGRNRYRARLPKPLPNESTFIEISTLRMWYSDREWWGHFPGTSLPINRTTVAVKDELIPEELRVMGGWVVPSGDDLRRGFLGRQPAIVARGAPAHLFPSVPMNAWTRDVNWVLLIQTLSVNESKFYWNNHTKFRANLVTYRPMEYAEVKAYWFPWLYSERAEN